MATTPETTDAVWRLIIAFRASRAIGVAVELGIPTYLSRHPHTAAQLAHDTSAHAPSLRRLLETLVALELLSVEGKGRYPLPALG